MKMLFTLKLSDNNGITAIPAMCGVQADHDKPRYFTLLQAVETTRQPAWNLAERWLKAFDATLTEDDLDSLRDDLIAGVRPDDVARVLRNGGDSPECVMLPNGEVGFYLTDH